MNVKRNLDQDWDGYWDEDLRNLSLATRNTHSFEIDGAQANVRRASLDAAAGSEGLGPCEMSAPCRWQRPVEACTRSRGSSSSDIIPKPEIFEMYETSSESTIEQPRRILPTRGGCRSFSRYGNQLPELHRRRAQIRWPDSGPKLNDNPSSRRCPATLQLSTAAGIIVLCCLLVYLLLYSSPSEFKEDTATDESLSESAEEGYEYSEQLRASLDSLKPSQEGRAALKASATSSDPSATASPTETPTGKTIAKTGFIGHAIGRPSTIATSNEPSKLPRLPDSVPYKVENAISPRCGPHFFTYCTSKASEYYYDAKTRQCTSTGPEGYAPDLCNYSRNRYRTHELCRKNCVIRNTPLMKCFEPSRLGACAQEHIRYRWWYFKDGRCQEWSFYNGTCPSEVPEGVYTSLQVDYRCHPFYTTYCSPERIKFYFKANTRECAIAGRDSGSVDVCNHSPNKFRTLEGCVRSCLSPKIPFAQCSLPAKFTACTQQYVRRKWWYYDEGRCQQWTFRTGECPLTSRAYSTLQDCVGNCSSVDARSSCRMPSGKLCAPHELKYPYFAVKQEDGTFRCEVSDFRTLHNHNCLIGPNQFATSMDCERACGSQPIYNTDLV